MLNCVDVIAFNPASFSLKNNCADHYSRQYLDSVCKLTHGITYPKGRLPRMLSLSIIWEDEFTDTVAGRDHICCSL